MEDSDGKLYTAKLCHHGDGMGNVTLLENIQWLREELSRAMKAQCIAKAFTSATVDKGISAHGKS